MKKLTTLFQLYQFSAKFKDNIDCLEETIYAAADIPDIHENDVIVTNVRHYEALIELKKVLNEWLKVLTTTWVATF